MARILIADDGIEFDGKTPEERPLGGVESSVVALTEALARRGHEVHVRNNCKAALDYNGVSWRPITEGTPKDWPQNIDLYIANRGDKLINLIPSAKKTVFWIHNPAVYLLKWRYLWKLWWRKPVIVFIGEYHATTLPSWVPDGGREIIPYGLPEAFCQASEQLTPPPQRAVFTSNPLRSLDWLLDVWSRLIQPNVVDAELHLFCGSATYGSVGEIKDAEMREVLQLAEFLGAWGVKLRGPVPKTQLVEELSLARVMLYRGDINETYCLAVGEAQAMGVPAVLEDVGSMYERVINGETGFVVSGKEAFAEAAIKLLKDDTLWRDQHRAALAKQRNVRWTEVAMSFEKLIEKS